MRRERLECRLLRHSLEARGDALTLESQDDYLSLRALSLSSGLVYVGYIVWYRYSSSEFVADGGPKGR
jgi:hypothetical protein